METKVTQNNKNNKFYRKSNDTTSKTESNSEVLVCPECNEPMHQKQGKEYYLCTKHWGYPNQVVRGIVKERKF